MEHTHRPKTTGPLAAGEGTEVHPTAPPAHGGPPHAHGGSPATHRPQERRRLRAAILLTGTMMVVEVIGGLWTGSLALLSDAAHMFTHAFALGVSLLALHLAALPVGKERTFGLYRVEVLAALFNGSTLALITVGIFYEAIRRLREPRPVASAEMLAIALAGLAVNLLTALILRGAGARDINVRSAFLHMLGDTASSGAVVVGALLIRATGWYPIDPLLSCGIALVILLWSVGLLRDSIHVLLECAPRHLEVDEVIRQVKARVPEVADLHDVHIWEITSQMYALTAHAVVEDTTVRAAVRTLRRINTVLDREFDIAHTNIQFECAGASAHEAGHHPHREEAHTDGDPGEQP